MSKNKFYYFSFSNIKSLYLFINSLPEQGHIIEVGQMHAGQHTLLVESPEDLLSSQLPQVMVEALCIPNAHPNLLKAYFKQIDLAPQPSLLILESPSLGTLFSDVNSLISAHNFSVIEISRNALPEANAFALLTHGNGATASSLISKNVSAQFFEKPNKHLLSLFGF